MAAGLGAVSAAPFLEGKTMDILTMIGTLGELTDEQTKRLAIACLSVLTDDDQIDAVKEALEFSTLGELAARIEDGP